MECIVNRSFVICLFTSTILFITNCSGQSPSNKSDKKLSTLNNDSIDKQIKEIRKDYLKINADSSVYKIEQENIDGESAEGGILKRFFYNDTLKKAVAIFFGEPGKSTTEYYFIKKEVIFVYDREDRYDTPIYSGKSKIKSTKENRYYFKDKKLIRWVGSNGRIIDNKQYPLKENEILNDLKEIQ